MLMYVCTLSRSQRGGQALCRPETGSAAAPVLCSAAPLIPQQVWDLQLTERHRPEPLPMPSLHNGTCITPSAVRVSLHAT